MTNDLKIKLKRFFRMYNEFIGFVLASILFVLIIPIIRFIDPTAAVFDMGVFHMIIYVIAVLLIGSSLSWFLLKVNFPSLFKNLDAFIDTGKGDISSKENKASLLIYFGYLICYIILFSLIF